MERAKCPQCSHEFGLRDLRCTSMGYWVACRPACGTWRDRDMYDLAVDPYTCANCRYSVNDHCHKVMLKLGLSGFSGGAHDDFSCSLWKGREAGPFIVSKLGQDNYMICSMMNNPLRSELYLSSCREAERVCDWLNSLWNEEKGENNESS